MFLENQFVYITSENLFSLALLSVSKFREYVTFLTLILVCKHEIRNLIGLMLRNFRIEFHENMTHFQTFHLKIIQIEKQLSKDKHVLFIKE